jgi:hypothetical protein
MGRLQELSMRATLALVVAGFLLFAVTGWFLLIGPKRSEAGQLEREIEATQVLLAAPVPEPEAQVDPEVAEDRLTQAMPDRVPMPAVILDLHRVAGEAGVRLDSIAPGPPVAQATYQTQPISLTLQGSYFGFSDFLRRLRGEAGIVDGEVRGDGRIYAVDTITFAEGESQFPNLSATLSISIAFGPVAPAPAAADPASEGEPADDGTGAMPPAPGTDSP